MKRENYDNLKLCFEAYERAGAMHAKYPDDPDYGEAVDITWGNLIEEIRHLLWDEAPEELKEPVDPNELPF